MAGPAVPEGAWPADQRGRRGRLLVRFSQGTGGPRAPCLLAGRQTPVGACAAAPARLLLGRRGHVSGWIEARSPGSREPPLKSLAQLGRAFIFVDVISFLLIPGLFFSSSFWVGNTRKQKKLGFRSGVTRSL